MFHVESFYFVNDSSLRLLYIKPKTNVILHESGSKWAAQVE